MKLGVIYRFDAVPEDDVGDDDAYAERLQRARARRAAEQAAQMRASARAPRIHDARGVDEVFAMVGRKAS